jgi:hypothetical protein
MSPTLDKHNKNLRIMLVNAYTMMFLWKSCKATAFDCDLHILCVLNVKHAHACLKMHIQRCFC